jgi:hypothetical protein
MREALAGMCPGKPLYTLYQLFIRPRGKERGSWERVWTKSDPFPAKRFRREEYMIGCL